MFTPLLVHCDFKRLQSSSLMGLRNAGRYLEIFGRKNNLRDYWVTVGNEVTGTGAILAQRAALPHIVRRQKEVA